MFRGLSSSEYKRLRRIKKSKKRKFIRPYSWEWKKLDESWRKPRGKDNKVRLQLKYRPPIVKVGYRTPKKIRYLHPSGKEEILVYKVEDLYNVDPLNQVVRIARTVGIRKRLEIIRFAEKFGIRVLNTGRAEAYLGISEAIIPEEASEETLGLEEFEAEEEGEEPSEISLEETSADKEIEEGSVEDASLGEVEDTSSDE